MFLNNIEYNIIFIKIKCINVFINHPLETLKCMLNFLVLKRFLLLIFERQPHFFPLQNKTFFCEFNKIFKQWWYYCGTTPFFWVKRKRASDSTDGSDHRRQWTFVTSRHLCITGWWGGNRLSSWRSLIVSVRKHDWWKSILLSQRVWENTRKTQSYGLSEWLYLVVWVWTQNHILRYVFI